MNHKRFYFIGLIVVVVLTGVFALFSKRDRILWSVIESRIEKFEANTAAKVTVRSFTMEGLDRLHISDLLLLTPSSDTLATVRRASIKFDFLSLLRLTADIDELDLDGVRLYPNDQLGNKRYHFLSSKSGTTEKSHDQGGKLSSFLRSYKGILSLLPSSLSVSDVIVVGYQNGSPFKASFPETSLKDGQLESQVIYRVYDNSGSSTEKCFILTGNVHDVDSEFSSLKVYPGNASSFPIVLTKGEESFSFSFDTLYVKFISDKRYENWEGNISLSTLYVDYARLASSPITVDSCSFDYRLILRLDPFEHIELDSSSVCSLNGFDFHPYFLYEKRDSFPTISIRAKRDSFLAQRMLDAFPPSIFPHISGMKTSGSLSYNFSLDLDFGQVDSVRFSSSMKKHDFIIDSYGSVDFRSVAQPFTYHAYDEEAETSFLVGPDNVDFTPLNEVSPYLKNAVLYSEDGLFYVHKGFLETAMNAAIAKDIQEKRFVRGGSTISMQLVKNLWLSREKTLSRKLEEAMIVWMIENNRLLTKDRMYEIYLNIIEWGPHIYGVKQASHFYFAKEPSELTPEEAIFMASVIPRPKKFMWFFDENGDLKPFLTTYFDILGDKLLKHNIITQRQRDELVHNVVVTGAAKAYLRSSITKLDDESSQEMDGESALINVLDKAMNNEDLSNGTNKKN